MRLLVLHVSRFSCTATQKGRSQLVEPLAERTTGFEDGLLILAAAESGDERVMEREGRATVSAVGA